MRTKSSSLWSSLTTLSWIHNQISVKQKTTVSRTASSGGCSRPDRRRIIFRTGFDVHSSFLDQTFISKIFQNFRMRAVCVKFDRITEIVDFLYKVFKVRRKRWFSRRRYRHLQGFPDAFLRKKELVLPESQVLLPDLIRERCSGERRGNCSVPERSLRQIRPG